MNDIHEFDNETCPEKILSQRIKNLYTAFPEIQKWFTQIAIPVISENMTLQELFESLSVLWFRDSGLTQNDILSVIRNIINDSEKSSQNRMPFLKRLTVLGGKDKSNNPEILELELKPGDIYGVTGLTGSGKTRFLEDIEYIAEGDSPSGRKILINGKLPSADERDIYENHLCACLSQSMNFVLELSCNDFIALHADCRKKGISKNQLDELKQQVIDCANNLAGEKIDGNSIITQLSGGQSRSLMIADIALVSDSPVVLIDEPENAGIDKDEILQLLASKGKIVLVSTHDPVIALSCPKRIVIKNGAVYSILETTAAEKQLLAELKQFDSKLKNIRNCIREGKYAC